MLPTETHTEILLSAVHTTDVIEAHFGLPFIMPKPSIVTMFTDKSQFSAWMVSHGFGEYVPAIYNSIDEVAYPALVKVIRGFLHACMLLVRLTQYNS